MNKKIVVFLVLIVALGFFLRFYQVTENPPSLNWDEVSIGYNAYSILKTGRDEWGQLIPINFKSYGEYKLPAQIYASIPGIFIFGLNELGVRITPVIYGTLTILLLFFLARKIFKNDFIGLTSAFLLAISPWHIQLTRASFESSFSVFWVVLGLWFLVKGFAVRKWWILSMVPFAFSVYTYNSARVFTPLFLMVGAFVYRKELLQFRKAIVLAIALFIVLIIPLVPYYLSGQGNARYKLVSITDDPGLLPRINENRGNSYLPSPLPRLIHNKITYIAFYVVENYLAHFTPDFLFISGASHKQHHVQNIGELYFFQAPFLLFGFYLLFKKRQQFRWLLTSWLLISIIPVSFTNDSIPQALRTLIAAPVYQIITALGIYHCFIWFKEKYNKLLLPIIVIFVVAVIISIGYYFYNYYVIYPVIYSRDWQYGNKQVVEYIQEHQTKYDEVVFTRTYGEPHMFTLFYLNYDPAKFQKDPNLVRYETNNWVWVLKFGKYYFPDLGDKGTQFKDIVAQNYGKRLLFIGKPGDFPDNIPKLKEVSFLSGAPAFDIVEIR